MELPIKQKLAFSIAFINTLVAIGIVLIFTAAFAYVSKENIHKDLLLEAEEIVTQHLRISNDKITLIPDTVESTTIEQDLLTDRLSAVLYTKDMSFLGSFGYFEIKQNLDSKQDFLKAHASQTCTSKNYQYFTDEGNSEQKFELLSYPIVSDGICRGVVIVGASMDSLLKLQQIALYLAILLVAVVLIINIFFGQFIAKLILKPFVSVSQKMHEVSIEQQVKPLPAARIKDELSQLTESFNAMVVRVTEGVTKQKEFIANASHELKTPIARVVSDLDMVSLYLRQNKEKEATQAIETAKQELKALHAVLESLLSAAKIKNAGMKMEIFSISNVIDNELSEYKNDVKNLHVTVTKSIANEKIKADKQVISVILRNLLQNAVKYNIANGKLSITSKIENNHLTLFIENTTSQKHMKSTMQQRYSRGDESIAGYGIGLSVVKEVCQFAGYRFTSEFSKNSFIVKIADIEIAEN